jgi:sugar phosphate permease
VTEASAGEAIVEARPQRDERAGWAVIGALVFGYVGIYLCRKNLAVAVPLLQDAYGANKEQVGRIASMGTLAYAVGKFVTGPLVDRVGARRGFLMSLGAVAVLGAAGAFAPGLGVLTLFYALNRFAGSAAWGAMVKLVPSWFRPARTGTVMAVLSLSYVAGGALATLLARQVLTLGGGWRAVMGVPALVLVAIAIACAGFVRVGPRVPAAEHSAVSVEPQSIVEPQTIGRWSAVVELLRRPQFLVVCALSFTLTLMRESFNTWSVDFLISVQSGVKSIPTAALQSIGFDLAGAVSILGAGWAYDRVSPARRRWAMAATLAALAGVLAVLPRVAAAAPLAGALLVGLVGLLVYGPYSLLAGALAVETGGARLAATSAGIIDGVGYIAGALAGTVLGRMLDAGGYGLGFGGLAVMTATAAVLALGLRSSRQS